MVDSGYVMVYSQDYSTCALMYQGETIERGPGWGGYDTTLLSDWFGTNWTVERQDNRPYASYKILLLTQGE